MGRQASKSKPSSSRGGDAAELFDSAELRVHQTPQMRQASDDILELTRSTGESMEFAPALTMAAVPSPRKSGKGGTDTTQKAPPRRSGEGSTTTLAMTVSTPLGSPSKKKSKKQSKSIRASAVQHASTIEPSTGEGAGHAHPVLARQQQPNKSDSGSVDVRIPVLDAEKGNGDEPEDHASKSAPKKAGSRGLAALSTTNNEEPIGGDGGGAFMMSPGAYSVRPGATNSVGEQEESESSSEDAEDSAPLSASRSVDSSAVGSADNTTTTTVTATAVTRDDLEQEVRERILREAVVAEVMVAAGVEPNPIIRAPPAPASASQSSPANVPDGFFTTSRPSVPDGFFTSTDHAGDSQSRVSFLLPEAPLEDNKTAREQRSGTGCCAACSPCCYKWRWWLVGLFSLLLVMGALGVVFGVVLPSQNKDDGKNLPSQPGNNIGGLRRTPAPSPPQNLNPPPTTQAPAMSSISSEPTVGTETPMAPLPVPTVTTPSAPIPTVAPATPYPQPTPTSSTPWSADTLLQFLMDNTMDGGMGLTVNGSPAKNAYDAIVGSSAFTGVPLDGQMVDVFALMCFYLLTNGASAWTNRQGWGEYPNPCEWYGITCNSAGRVAMLTLPSNGIRGGLSMDINNMRDQLTSLNLSGNQLMFDKSNLSKLYRLQHLNISQASVDVAIDSLLGSDLTAFSSLQVFDVSSNSMVGPIPTGFGAMTQLRRLLVQNNQFTGSIPTELSQLTNLNAAKFEGNGLSGSVPEGLCQLKGFNRTSSLKMLSVDCAEVGCSCCNNC